MKKLLALTLSATLLLAACGSPAPAPELAPIDFADFETADEITETNGLLHSVPLEDIYGKKSGYEITVVDDPEFVSVEEADKYIDPENPGLAVDINGTERYYPFGPSAWHIVNDEIAGESILVTYCPLCATGIVFDPSVNGQQTTFTATGELWNSNMVMTDALTDSSWSQILGEAIVGPETGDTLELLPHQNIRWKDWKQQHPNGEVLNFDLKYHDKRQSAWQKDTYDTDVEVKNPLDHTQNIVEDKALTYGIEVDGVYKVYLIDGLIESPASFTDQVNGITIEINFNHDDETATFTRLDTGQEVVPTYGFFFAWYAVHPDTEIY